MQWAVWYVTVRARDPELSQPHPVSGMKGPQVETVLAVEAADAEEAKRTASMEMGSRGLSVVGYGPVRRGRSIDLHSELKPNSERVPLQEGDVLTVERLPVYASSGTGRGRRSQKTVARMEREDGRAFVELRESPRRRFQLTASGMLLDSGGPGQPPLRYEIVWEDEVEPNKRARSLQQPAMDTRFGETLEDPDSIVGPEGKQLDAALNRYETFHAKKPIRIAELTHDIPTTWVPVGDALAVMYRTDKWKRDGSDIDYKHLHDKSEDKPYDVRKGVRFFEPASAVSGRSRKLPVAVPKAVTLLGYCLGLFVRKDGDEQVYETNPRGCYLFSSPSGDLLLVYSPDEQADGTSGFLAAMAGGKLRVLKDGIDG